jgi:uncharacterized protein YaeQ
VALKPTIYKIKISLSDIDGNHYDNFDLTIAQHPSESRERMMARVLAFNMNARKNIRALAALVQRTMDLSITISDNVVYVSAKNGECEVSCVTLQPAAKSSEHP